MSAPTHGSSGPGGAARGTVLVTGGSGFVGAHLIRRLLDDGYAVRALVRTPQRLADALGLVDVDVTAVTVVEGGMTDRAAVDEAAAGCQGAVHAAATFSFKRSDNAAMMNDNAAGTRTVLEAAREAGCESVVHVSSTVALNRPDGSTLDHRSLVGRPTGPYSASKVASESIARTMQHHGAPVTIVNPGSIVGPDDPHLGESNKVLADALGNRIPIYPRGLLHYVDVRDVAATLVAALEHGRTQPGGRFIVPGTALPSPHPLLSQVTGRRILGVRVPAELTALASMPGHLTGLPFLPGAVEGIRQVGCNNPVDARETTRVLGVEARPIDEVFTDTVRWLAEAGHITAGQAGRLSAARTPRS